ncbi:unnamed protein product [Peronospora belbahrii]|uniref:Uncharacterized protein n=1 Tax=Peronospora belbahrii TaxID=622444 RepID=A0AAU9KVS3_9STRA|nr:unnamed protein product [Peronospora belbahrii]
MRIVSFEPLLGQTDGIHNTKQNQETNNIIYQNDKVVVASSVPSLLHLYRPVSAPSLRPQFGEIGNSMTGRREKRKSSRRCCGVKRIDKSKKEAKEIVTLKVMLLCSLDAEQVEVVVDEDYDELKRVERQQMQRVRHDALLFGTSWEHIAGGRTMRCLLAESLVEVAL